MRSVAMIFKIDKTLDVRGLRSSRLKAPAMDVIGKMEAGQVVQVIADDRGAKQEVPQLCKSMGWELVDLSDQGGVLSFIIKT